MNTPVVLSDLTEDQLIELRQSEIQEALRRFSGKKQGRREPSSYHTPLSALIQSEDANSGEEDTLEVWAIRSDAIRTFAAYVSQDGPHPVDVLRNLYAVFGHMGLAPFCELTLREKALLFGDSHESHRWLMRKLCLRPLQRLGAQSIRAPGAKGREASEAAARVQKGNTNRRKGKAARKSSRSDTGVARSPIPHLKNKKGPNAKASKHN